jgi:GTP-binding protein Era
MTQETRCGFIALIGAPNAGKSTLLNTLVGSKISIVTPKAQTTRSRITGVCIHNDAQLVLVDVPGVFRAKQRLEKAMVERAWGSAGESDIVLFMHDVKRSPDDETEQMLDQVKGSGKPLYLVLNKVDILEDKARLLELGTWFKERAPFNDIFMISALKKEGVIDILEVLSKEVPAGPWLFPEDELTDIPVRFMAAEFTREQCFLRLREELPYTLSVDTEEYKERDDGSVEIRQIIIVQNERQKMIVLGKGGAQIKEIGAAARQQISKALEQKVHLFLFVKVREDWKDNPETYRMLGLNHG